MLLGYIACLPDLTTGKSSDAGPPVDEVHGDVHDVIRIPLESEVVVENEREDATSVVILLTNIQIRSNKKEDTSSVVVLVSHMHVWSKTKGRVPHLSSS